MMAQTWKVAVAGLLLAPWSAHADVPQSEFDAIAAHADRIDVRGVPMWMNGSFRVGEGSRGTVKRVAVGRSEGHGESDRSDAVDVESVVRHGRVSFAVVGPEVGTTLEGACRYDRGEVRMTVQALTIAEPTVPLLYRCTFSREGQAVGAMELAAVPDRPGLVQRSLRRGRVEMGGTTLDIVSMHRLGPRRIATDLPVGYAFMRDGEAVGAIDVNAMTRRRLALPRDPAQRDAAMAASLALALFWDPGDTDD